MIGETLGSFRIVSELGTGGMGVIYQAEHQMIGKRAAIKVLRPELSRDREVVGRFFNEAKAVTAIDHPGLVDVYDFGYTADGSAYIVMELLSGESLAARLRRDPPPIEVTIALVRQLCGALAAAHARSIVHRDLKPDNIFLTPDPDVAYGLRAKVLDFGIAKLAPGLGGLGTPETRTGMLLGTPLYMAPEQCRGAAEVDHRADIYALGVIMFEMVCGQVPFTGIGIGEVIGKHQYEPPPPPRSLAPALPPAIEALILRMLAKPPDHRPQSMNEVLAALGARGSAAQTVPTVPTVATVAPSSAHQWPAALATGTTPPTMEPVTTPWGGGAVPAPTAPRRALDPRRRRRVLVAGAAIVAIGAVGAAVSVVALRRRVPDPLFQLDLLPADTAFVLGIDVTRLEQTPLWREEGPKIVLAATRGDDEHTLDQLRVRCDLDPVRDLHWVTYAFATSATSPGDGALLIDGAWDRDKLERCVALLAPEQGTNPQPLELAGSPIRRYGNGAYIAWVTPHTAAIAVAHNGLAFLRELVEHPSHAADRALLQRAVVPIDRDAVFWIAGAAPSGLPADLDPLDLLSHATETSLSITLGDELDAHGTVTTTPIHAAELQSKLAAELAQARLQVPLVDQIKVAVRGDVLAVELHLDTSKLATVAALIDSALARAAPPPPAAPPAPHP